MEGNSLRRVSSHRIIILVTNTRNINVVAILEQYSICILIEKNNGVAFLYIWLLSVHN